MATEARTKPKRYESGSAVTAGEYEPIALDSRDAI